MNQAINQVALSIGVMRVLSRAVRVAQVHCSEQGEYDRLLEVSEMIEELRRANKDSLNNPISSIYNV